MVEKYPISRRSCWLAILCTIFVSGLVISILLLILLRTPVPPYPEEGGGSGNGIELNLGFSIASAENNPQDLASQPEIDKAEPKIKPESRNEKILTQDVEDAPTLNDKEVKTKKNKKTTPKEITVPSKIQKESPKPQVNNKAMYHPVKNQNGTDPNSNISGNQGNPNGNLGAKAFGGQNGKGGTGDGTGGGQGSGNGSGNGPTASANLQERNPVLPLPLYNQQVEGVVVVSVTVNSDGVVIEAIPGVKGSTTLEQSLLDAARQAALKAHFDQKPGSLREKGTIRYHFRLQ